MSQVSEEDAPIDDGDGLAVRAVAVGKELVVNADVFEAFDDRERRAREDGLDVTRRRLVVHGRWGIVAGGGRERGRKRLGLEETDTMVWVCKQCVEFGSAIE